MAIKEATSKDREKIVKDCMFQGGKVQLKSAARGITKDAVVVETLRTLLKEDKNIQDSDSHEGMLDICRKFKMDRNLWNAKNPEELKEVIEQHFIDTCLSGEKLTDLYKQLFNDNKLVFDFTDFMVADDLIPKTDPDKVPKDLFYRKETLGTGEYETDENGVQLPHEDDFATECAYEIVHFLTHLSGSNLFVPRRSPDFSLQTLDNDKIMVRVDLINPLDLV